jgi:predicted Zn-dependent protease
MYINDVSGPATRLGLGVNVFDKLTSKLTSKIPDQVEIYLGNQSEPDVVKEYGGLHPSKELHDYVNMVGLKTAKVSSRPKMPYGFQVVRSQIPNAFALPNAKISITHGLLATMDNEAQLAAVLAHEAGHVENRHSLKELEENLGTGLLATGVSGILTALAGKSVGKDGAAAVGALAGGVKQMVDMGYSRQSESEADASGLKNMVAAGYNPLGMVQLMQKFQQMEGSGQQDIVQKYMSSHPAAKDRVDAAQAGIAKKFPEAVGSLPFNEDEYAAIMVKYPLDPEQQAKELAAGGGLSPAELAAKVAGALGTSVGGLSVGWWIGIASVALSGALLWKSLRRA